MVKVIKNERLELKLKSSWRLSQIKTIKILNEDQQYSKFELAFNDSDKSLNSKYEWKCETRDDCIHYLTALWKLSQKFLVDPNRPKFINFKPHLVEHTRTYAFLLAM